MVESALILARKNTRTRYCDPVLCSERERLWSEYNHALGVFTARAEELGLPFTVATFGQRIMAVQAANEDSKRACQAWEADTQLHRCDKPESS